MRQDPRVMLAVMSAFPEQVAPEVRAWWVDAVHRAGHDPAVGHEDYAFGIAHEQISSTEWGYTLAGRRRGPFASPKIVEADLREVVRLWRDRACGLGGWVWRPEATRLLVTLPVGVPMDASLSWWAPRFAPGVDAYASTDLG